MESDLHKYFPAPEKVSDEEIQARLAPNFAPNLSEADNLFVLMCERRVHRAVVCMLAVVPLPYTRQFSKEEVINAVLNANESGNLTRAIVGALDALEVARQKAEELRRAPELTPEDVPFIDLIGAFEDFDATYRLLRQRTVMQQENP